MRILTLGTALAAAITAVSCKKATSADLAGSYTAERSHGFESLDIRTNGTYVQVFTNATLIRTNTGTWSYQAPTLTLRNALMFDDGSNRPVSLVVTNDWQLKVRRLFNIWVFEDRQAQPFSQVTPENQ